MVDDSRKYFWLAASPFVSNVRSMRMYLLERLSSGAECVETTRSVFGESGSKARK